MHSIAARFLGSIHGCIGLRQKCINVFGDDGGGGYPETRRDAQRACWPIDYSRRYCLAEFFCRRQRAFATDMGQNDGEFFTSEPPKKVTSAAGWTSYAYSTSFPTPRFCATVVDVSVSMS